MGEPSGPFLPYGRQRIDDEDVRAVVEALRAPRLTQGPLVERFEKRLAEACGAPFAVAVSSGTAALHVACLAAGLRPGDRLLSSPVTFVASANCALYCGAEPDFADIDPATLLLSPERLAARLDRRVAAVVPVHLGGLSADLAAIRERLRAHEASGGRRVFLIEDACHALGGTYRGEPVGSCRHSDLAVFSFHALKSITTGEGGAVLTRDPELDRRLRLFRSHGITREPALLEADPGPWHYEQQELGFNYRLTDLQCALGLSQLERLPERIRRRTELAGLYDRAFADRPELVRPPRAEGAASAWHLYVVQADFEGRGTTRAAVMERLASKGIGTQVHYIPVYRQPYYRRRWGDRRAEFPAAERYFERALSLPLHPSMSDDDAGRVAREFLAALGL